MSIVLRSVEAGYGAFAVLQGVDLEVRPGSIGCLVGPNGSGKSTVMRVIAGFLAPRRGDVLLDGAPLPPRPQRVLRAGVAYVPQRPSVFPGLTVHENLQMGLYTLPRREVRARLDEAYARFPRLAERRRQPAGALSGGERRTLELCRALLLRPRVLLLDEPSIGLAPGLVDELLGRVREINASGVTVLMVEQNVDKALRVSDDVFVLRLGRIVYRGAAGAALQERRVQELFLGG